MGTSGNRDNQLSTRSVLYDYRNRLNAPRILGKTSLLEELIGVGWVKVYSKGNSKRP